MTSTEQLRADADLIIARMRERNPQLDEQTGAGLALEEFAFAVLVVHRALAAGDSAKQRAV